MKKPYVECSNCWFWHRLSENTGECRVNPPIPFSPAMAGSISKAGIWVQTKNDEWCGYFKPEKSKQ